MLRDNGHHYHVLINATKKIKGIPGLTCEVGLREGGGSKYIVDALMENEDFNRTHIAIDPYGSIPYIQSEEKVRGNADEPKGPYPNKMMKRCLSEMYFYIYDKDIEFLFFPLEDTEFFMRYADGIPVYKDGRKFYRNIYALTYLDGPHSTNSTMREAVFFGERTNIGGVMIFDDVVNYYDHSKIKEYLLENGWKELEATDSKISYIKMTGDILHIAERQEVEVA